MNIIEMLNEWALVWYAFMRERSIESAIAFVFVGLIWMAMRRWSSPQFNGWLFLLVLVKLALPIHLNAPAWLSSMTISSAASHVTKASFPSHISFTPTEQVSSFHEDKAKTYPAATEKIHSEAPSISSSRIPEPSLAADWKPNASILTWLMMSWAFIVIMILTKYVRAEWRMHRLRREGKPITTSDIPVNIEELKQRMGVKCAIRCLESPVVPTPVVTGILHPVLIFPSRFFEQFSSNQLRWTILHELAHIRRMDTMLIFLQKLAQIFFFFNPFVWASNWMIDQQREYACDDMALAASGSTRLDCGRGFLMLAKRLNSTASITTGSIGLFTYKYQIRRRMMRLLNENRTINAALSYRSMALLFGIAFAILLSARANDTQTGASHDSDATMTLSFNESSNQTLRDVDEAFTLQRLNRSISGWNCISPSQDGRFIMFMDWKTHQANNIAVREISTGKTWLITNNRASDDNDYFPTDPILSPDNKQIVYSWPDNEEESGNELHIMDFDGANSRVLCKIPEVSYVRALQWSSDGKLILAQAGKKIYLISVSEGTTRELALPDELSFPYICKLSSDNKYLAYSVPQFNDPSNENIYLFDLESETKIPLIEDPFDNRFICWTPDGQWILFQSNRVGSRDTWIVRVENGACVGFPRLVQQNLGEIFSGQMTKDGSFYFHIHDTGGPSGSYTSKLDWRQEKLGDSIRSYGKTLPAWSKDGDSICWAEPSNAIVVQSQDKGEIRKYSVPAYAYCLRWSHDNRFIYFSDGQSRPPQPHAIYKLDVETGDAVKLFEDPHRLFEDFELSPDSEKFYLKVRDSWRRSKKKSIISKDIQSGKERELYSDLNLNDCQGFRLSPDGKWIAACLMNQFDYVNAIQIISTERGDVRQLVDLRNKESAAFLMDDMGRIPRIEDVGWLLQGESLYFMTFDLRDEKGSTLWKTPFEKWSPQKIGEMEQKISRLLFHPDNQQIAFLTFKNNQFFEYWRMKNFLPAE